MLPLMGMKAAAAAATRRLLLYLAFDSALTHPNRTCNGAQKNPKSPWSAIVKRDYSRRKPRGEDAEEEEEDKVAERESKCGQILVLAKRGRQAALDLHDLLLPWFDTIRERS